MNRELKFRVWNEFRMLTDKELRKTAEELYNEADKVGQYEGCIIIPKCEDLKVMQYTGLKDGKGIEIYEGDIIEFYSLTENDFVRGEVVYHFGIFRIGDYMLVNHFRSCKVIGNIHENKDLLEL